MSSGATQVAMVSSRCLLVASLSVFAVVVAENKIYGGEEVDIREVPWQVSVQNNGTHICGGTIISNLWVLSAAHCCFDYKLQIIELSQIRLRVGSSSWKDGGMLYQVEQLVSHTQFDYGKGDNDISALKLSTPLIFDGSTVVAAKLPVRGATRISVGTMVRVSGWGLMENGQYPIFLRAVDVPINDFSVCEKEATLPIVPDVTKQLCAGALDNSACHKDSGGPLVKGDQLVGIVSYKVADCAVGKVVYTDVTVYRDWIKTNTGV